MPTYTYVCAACGHRFDHLQSMTAKLLRKCPACSQRKLERMIGAGAGLIFRGSGFYVTDYRSGGGDAAKDGAAGKDAKAPGETPQADATKPNDGGDRAGKNPAS